MESEGDKKQILLVDDDPNIRRFLTESLRLRGYNICSFEDAESALQEIGNNRFDLALLDILLPGINGLQLCRKLRSLPGTAEMPIIMMTAFYKQADHIRDAREQFGATDYLLKPFPLRTLHEKIESLLGASKAVENSERLSVEGNLTETTLPQILHNLYSLRTTGLLHLEQGDLKKVVYIRNGYPIFVRSNLVREFLGQMLVRKGVLSEEELERSLKTSREQGRRHGMVMVEMGLITPHLLDETLRCQVTEKLLETFSWAEGNYRFIQVREFKQGVTSIDLSPANLILQGLREYASRDQTLKILEPHMDNYLQQAENPLYRFQEVQLTSNEQRIFESCQGQTTLRELLKRYTLSRKEAEPLLAAMLSTGILIGNAEAESATASDCCDPPQQLRAKREAFLKDYAWMMDQDYFTLLGVSESDSREQIRKSYYNLVKKYHPDSFFDQEHLPELKEKTNVLFQRISTAHETLIDSKARARYCHDLKGETSGSSASPENILKAETAYQNGVILLKVKKYREAANSFAEALELSPNEAEHLMYHAWASYKANQGQPSRSSEALKQLTRALKLNPKLGLTHLYLGYIHKDAGEEKEARSRFEKAIRCNPDCTEALRELRLMNMRREKVEKEKKRIFGQKSK